MGNDTISDFAAGDTIALRNIDGVTAFGDITVDSTEGGFEITFGDGNALTVTSSLQALEAEHFDFL